MLGDKIQYTCTLLGYIITLLCRTERHVVHPYCGGIHCNNSVNKTVYLLLYVCQIALCFDIFLTWVQMVQKHNINHCPTKNDILFHVYFVQMLSLSGRAPRDVPINPAPCMSCAPDSWKALHSLWKSNTIPCESPALGCRGLSTTEPRTGLSWNLPQSFWARLGSIWAIKIKKVLPRKKHILPMDNQARKNNLKSTYMSGHLNSWNLDPSIPDFVAILNILLNTHNT